MIPCTQEALFIPRIRRNVRNEIDQTCEEIPPRAMQFKSYQEYLEKSASSLVIKGKSIL